MTDLLNEMIKQWDKIPPCHYITPPTFYNGEQKGIFLGGSIEMGKAKDWQKEFLEKFAKKNRVTYSWGPNHKSWSYPYLNDYMIFNPRRPDWNESWLQNMENPQFFQQVTWELDHLEKAKHKVFYFAENTLSPITLLELGTFRLHPNVYICWDDGYLRKGNLEIYCYRYNLRRYKDLDEIIDEILKENKDGRISYPTR